MAFRTISSSMWKIVAIVPFLAVMLIAGGCGSVKSNAPDVGQSVTITLNLQSASVAVGTTKQFSAVVANTVQHGRHMAGKRGDRRRFDSRRDRYDRKIHRPRSAAFSGDCNGYGCRTSRTFQDRIGDGDYHRVRGAVSVTMSAATVSVQTGHTQSITATVQNDSQSKGVTWTLTGSGCTGAACGTLSATSSASGTAITYTAPATVPYAGNCYGDGHFRCGHHEDRHYDYYD